MAAAAAAHAAAAAAAAAAAPLYHLVPEAAWRAAAKEEGGGIYTPPTYTHDGFTHLTADPKLLLGVANHFYTGVAGAYLVVELDPARLDGPVVFEPAAPVGSTPALGAHGSGGGDGGDGGDAGGQKQQQDEVLFPHLYAPINTAAAVRELAVDRAPDGTFLKIHGLPDGSS